MSTGSTYPSYNLVTNEGVLWGRDTAGNDLQLGAHEAMLRAIAELEYALSAMPIPDVVILQVAIEVDGRKLKLPLETYVSQRSRDGERLVILREKVEGLKTKITELHYAVLVSRRANEGGDEVKLAAIVIGPRNDPKTDVLAGVMQWVPERSQA